MPSQPLHSPQKGVLLVNLGTPNSPKPSDVYRYLTEFLTDARVIDYPRWKRELLVRGIIVPFRFRQSAALYKKLWTSEGSPLLIHSQNDARLLQESLGPTYKVELAMRYQNPSIQKGLNSLRDSQVSEIIVLPLFPQYASATTGSIQQKVMEIVKEWPTIPKMTFISSYETDPRMIEAFCERGRKYPIESYDGVLFSFHGLPMRQIKKADCTNTCLSSKCCEKLEARNRHCYSAQCYATARAIAMSLSIKNYQICFQSRLGNEPWLQPYASDILHECAAKGMKKLLVFSPSFVSDCLETTLEIGEEYAAEFIQAGGKSLQLVEGLNSHPLWIEALVQHVI